MEEVKHTSNGWYILGDEEVNGFPCIEIAVGECGKSDYWPIAFVMPVGNVEVISLEDRARALTISAAPDLLEAAKLALGIAEDWIHDRLDGTPSFKEALDELDPVRAAIAKAEGRT